MWRCMILVKGFRFWVLGWYWVLGVRVLGHRWSLETEVSDLSDMADPSDAAPSLFTQNSTPKTYPRPVALVGRSPNHGVFSSASSIFA
jgi:hypothetical protein